ncbi:MAG: hypothetical protein RI922_978 [Bacteroidota bacterium]|jgi:hypothetical protein
MKKLLFSSFILLGLISFSQKNVFVTISPKFAGADLQMAVDYTSINGVVLNLDHFDYYLSDLHVIHDGGQDLDLSDTVFLVEPQNHILYLGYIDVTNIEQLNFAIGVPAVINTSAGAQAIDISQYPEGHPLSFQDPSMYWGWTAGYMHMIIGGLADSNSDGIADAPFEVHTVGDLNYRHVQLPVIQTNKDSNIVDIAVDCNVDYWIKDIPIETVGILHGSTGVNMEIMKNVETEPVFTQPTTASNQQLNESAGNIFASQNANETIINWSDINNISSYSVSDINGKKIEAGKAEGNKGSITFGNLNSGVYFFHLLNTEGKELKQLKFSK